MRNLAIICLLGLAGCSSVRMNYTAQVKMKDGRHGAYEFTSSKKLKATPILCGVTAIVYGGWCWAYLFLPTHGDEMYISEQARRHMDAELGAGNYSAYDEMVTHSGWGKALPDGHFIESAQ